MIGLSQTVTTPRNTSYDFLRVAAAFAVVWVHVSTGVVFFNPTLDNPQWWVGDFADAFGRWCVPIFIMLSGALLLPKSRKLSPREFLVSYMPRILWPAFFWSTFYLLFSYSVAQNIDEIGFFLALMGGKPFFHLWYFYLAIALYALTPVLQKFYDQLSWRKLVIVAAFCFGLSTVASAPELGGGLFVAFTATAYLSYFLLGAALAERPPLNSIQQFYAVSIAALCGVIIAGCAAALMPHYGSAGWEFMFSYANIFVAVMGVCIFWAGISIKAYPHFSKLGPYTLGIYGIHPLWVMALGNFGISGFSFGPLIGIPLTAVLVFLLSLASVFILAQIKFLRPVLM